MFQITNHLNRNIAITCALLVALGFMATTTAQAALLTTPGLTTVTVWEATGPVTPYNFVFNGPQMTTQLGVGVLGPGTFDISSLPNEQYDVFYSDAAGNFNLNGDYVTVEAVYTNPSGGGGLNLGAVDLTVGSSTIRADILASFVGLGPNYSVGSEVLAVDPDSPVPTTFTSMGSTVVPPTQHLRVTVGWSKIPEPASAVLALGGILGVLAMRRKTNL